MEQYAGQHGRPSPIDAAKPVMAYPGISSRATWQRLPAGLACAVIAMFGAIAVDISRADLSQSRVATMMAALCEEPRFSRSVSAGGQVDRAFAANLRSHLAETGFELISLDRVAGPEPQTSQLRSVVAMPTGAAAFLGADIMHVVVMSPCRQPSGVTPDHGLEVDQPVLSAGFIGS